MHNGNGSSVIEIQQYSEKADRSWHTQRLQKAPSQMELRLLCSPGNSPVVAAVILHSHNYQKKKGTSEKYS